VSVMVSLGVVRIVVLVHLGLRAFHTDKLLGSLVVGEQTGVIG
jgi:hypothetical protein